MDTANTSENEAFAGVNRVKEPADGKTMDFARELVAGTIERRDELDGRIEAAAENWALSRMAAVDRNILRLAAFELAFRRDTPVSVVIDEAIEIARKFSTEDSTRFINGILDKIKDARTDHGGSQANPS